jgi:hypothetical protein
MYVTLTTVNSQLFHTQHTQQSASEASPETRWRWPIPGLAHRDSRGRGSRSPDTLSHDLLPNWSHPAGTSHNQPQPATKTLPVHEERLLWKVQKYILLTDTLRFSPSFSVLDSNGRHLLLSMCTQASMYSTFRNRCYFGKHRRRLSTSEKTQPSGCRDHHDAIVGLATPFGRPGRAPDCRSLRIFARAWPGDRSGVAKASPLGPD